MCDQEVRKVPLSHSLLLEICTKRVGVQGHQGGGVDRGRVPSPWTEPYMRLKGSEVCALFGVEGTMYGGCLPHRCACSAFP